MKRQIYRILLTVLINMAGAKAFAYDAKIDGIYYDFSGTEAIVTNSEYSYSGAITIPSSVENNGKTYYVTRIGDRAFYGCTGMTSITIPSSVTSIGSHAFDGCTGLTSLIIPNSVTTIEEYTFQGCKGLTSVTIPNSVTSIGIRTFEGCTGLTNPVYNETFFVCMPATYEGEYVIPDGIIAICEAAFAHCSGLTSVTIPNSVKSIGYDAFSYCSSLTSVTVKMETPITIHSSVFSNAANATLTVPVGACATYRAAEGWNQFKSILNIDGSAEYADGDTFTAKTIEGVSLTFKIISTAEKTCQVGNGSSAAISTSCSDRVSIPDVVEGYTVKRIGARAFNNCTSLPTVVIPRTVSVIGDYAFYGCTELEDVISFIEEPFNVASNVFSGISEDAWLSIPYGSKTKYQAASGWDAFYRIEAEKVIVDNICYAIYGGDAWVKEAPYYIYSGKVTIPSSITTNGQTFDVVGVDDEAFAGSDITSVTIGSRVTTIDDDAFSLCTKLSSVVIPVSVVYFGDNAFYGCSKLTSVTSLIKNPTSISSNVFSGIPSNATLHVRQGCKEQYELKNGWNQFGNIIVDIDMEIVDGDTFTAKTSEGVTMLFSITSVSNKTVSVGNGTDPAISTSYSGNVTIPTTVEGYTVTAINSRAFKECNITSCILPESVTSIGRYAFRESGLTSLEIPRTVTRIGKYILYDCKYVTAVTSYISGPKATEYFDDEDYGRVYRTADLYVPYDTKAKYQAVDGWKEFENIVELKETFEVDGINYYVEHNPLTEGVEEVAYVETPIVGKTYEGSVIIPDKVTLDDGRTLIVEGVGSKAFRNSPISEISLPHTIKSIGSRAFQRCKLLEGIAIPEGVTRIEELTFVECEKLENVTLPSTLTYIEMDAFSECPSISRITSYIQNPFEIDVWTFASEKEEDDDIVPDMKVYENATLYVPYGTKKLYEATAYWNAFKSIVEQIPDTDISELGNVVYIEPIEAAAGVQLTISVKMKNTVNAESFGFDLYLPDGVTVATDEDGFVLAELSTERTTEKKTNHFDAKCKQDGSLNVQAYSSRGYTISGNDGEVALITVNISKDMESGDYPIILKNIAIADENSVTYRESYVKTTLTISAYTLGDANGDGYIDVGDLTAISHYILERPDAGFNSKAADANSDGSIDVGDLTAVSHIILWGTIQRPDSTAARKPQQLREPQ